MATDIRDRTRKLFDAWNATSNQNIHPVLPHPRHEQDECPSDVEGFESDEPPPFSEDSLEAELLAWEQASDEDYEKFEEGLE